MSFSNCSFELLYVEFKVCTFSQNWWRNSLSYGFWTGRLWEDPLTFWFFLLKNAALRDEKSSMTIWRGFSSGNSLML